MASGAESKLSATERHQLLFKRFSMPSMVFGVAAAVYVLQLSGGPQRWFSWHPVLMTLACIPVIINATLLKKIGGLVNTRWHGYLFVLTTLLTVGGWYVIYSNKEMNGYPHLTSWHSWTGLFVLASFCGSSVFGLVALFPDWGVLKTNKSVRWMHKWGARVTIAVSWVTLVSGFIKLQPELTHQAIFAVPLLFSAYFVLL